MFLFAMPSNRDVRVHDLYARNFDCPGDNIFLVANKSGVKYVLCVDQKNDRVDYAEAQKLLVSNLAKL